MKISPHDHTLITAKLRAGGSVFAEEEATLLMAEAASTDTLNTMVDQRVSGQPIEYIVGWAEFDGIKISIESGVFVPRHRTEFLVHEAVKMVRPHDVVVDLCCGSGALGVAIAAKEGGSIQLYAADIESVAVHCARGNIAAIGGKAYQGDLFDALPTELCGHIRVVVANAPYVPTDAIKVLPAEARLYELSSSLDGGTDGLAIHRRIAAQAGDWLASGGRLLTEVSEQQARIATELFADSGFSVRLAYDEERETTVLIATKR